jgi:hypothetical protein
MGNRGCLGAGAFALRARRHFPGPHRRSQTNPERRATRTEPPRGGPAADSRVAPFTNEPGRAAPCDFCGIPPTNPSAQRYPIELGSRRHPERTRACGTAPMRPAAFPERTQDVQRYPTELSWRRHPERARARRSAKAPGSIPRMNPGACASRTPEPYQPNLEPCAGRTNRAVAACERGALTSGCQTNPRDAAAERTRRAQQAVRPVPTNEPEPHTPRPVRRVSCPAAATDSQGPTDHANERLTANG